MQCLHLDLIVVDLLPDPCKMVPHILPLLLYRLLALPLLLSILVKHLLHIENLLPLLLSLKHYILLKLVLSDLFRPFIHALLLQLRCCVRYLGYQRLLLSPLCLYHLSVATDALVDKELFTHVHLHKVRVVTLYLVIQLLCLMDHVKTLLSDQLLVDNQCLLSLFLQLIILYLAPDSVSLKLELDLLGNFLWVLEWLQLDLLLGHRELLLVLLHLFLDLLFSVVEVVQNVEAVALKRGELLCLLTIVVVYSVLQLVMHPVHVCLLSSISIIELLSFL